MWTIEAVRSISVIVLRSSELSLEERALRAGASAAFFVLAFLAALRVAFFLAMGRGGSWGRDQNFRERWSVPSRVSTVSSFSLFERPRISCRAIPMCGM